MSRIIKITLVAGVLCTVAIGYYVFRLERGMAQISLPLTIIGGDLPPTANHFPGDGVDTAKTVENLKKSLPYAEEWKEAEFREHKFLFAFTLFGAGQPRIDVHGWMYYSSFKEWRRIVLVRTRLVGYAALSVDEKKGVVSLHGIANNEFKGEEVFRFDLRSLSDGPEQIK